MRQIVLDTETTGLDPREGHRIIEIGCVELVNRQLTDKKFQVYLNPERKIDEGAAEVHGISNEFLQNKPYFVDVVDDFIAFLKDAELVIHNAPFDTGFINYELSLLKGYSQVETYCTVLDTLVLAKKKHPGQRNSLDALCKRYNVDNSHRDLHGALLDAEILADVYLSMTGGQTSWLVDEFDMESAGIAAKVKHLSKNRSKLKIIYPSDQEMLDHHEKLELIDKASGGKCMWKR